MTAWRSAPPPRSPRKIIAASKGRLKVIGRAGIGVDNVDIPAATAQGIIVMNTPFGNSITTAEHAIAMLFACARQIPAADASTQAGKWEEEPLHGCRADRQGARHHRLRQHRLHRRPARPGPGDAGDRFRSFPFGGSGGGARRRESGTRRAVPPRRLHYAAHPAHRQDPQRHRRRRHRADEGGRAHRQLRPRRARRRGRAARRAGFRQGRRRGHGRVRQGAGEGERPVRRPQPCVHAASGRLHHRSAGRMSPSRSPSRWRTT